MRGFLGAAREYRHESPHWHEVQAGCHRSAEAGATLGEGEGRESRVLSDRTIPGHHQRRYLATPACSLRLRTRHHPKRRSAPCQAPLNLQAECGSCRRAVLPAARPPTQPPRADCLPRSSNRTGGIRLPFQNPQGKCRFSIFSKNRTFQPRDAYKIGQSHSSNTHHQTQWAVDPSSHSPARFQAAARRRTYRP